MGECRINVEARKCSRKVAKVASFETSFMRVALARVEAVSLALVPEIRCPNKHADRGAPKIFA